MILRKAHFLSFLFLSAWAAVFTLHAQTPDRPASQTGIENHPSSFDQIHLADGTVLRGKVNAMNDQSITFQEQITGGHRTRQIPTPSVLKITFQIPTEIDRALRERNWKQDSVLIYQTFIRESQHLHRKEHYIGSVGLLYIELALSHGSPPDLQEAHRMCLQIEKHDWNPKRISQATAFKIKVLIALGKVEEAQKLVHEIERQSQNPILRVETELIMNHAKLAQLKALIQKHPRWQEDDMVLDEITELADSIIEAYLRPSLFHGDQQELAAEGLDSIRQVYHLIHQNDRIQQYQNDLIHLYPNTTFAKRIQLDQPKLSVEAQKTVEDPRDGSEKDHPSSEKPAPFEAPEIDHLKRMLLRSDQDQLQIYRLETSKPKKSN